MNENDGTTTDQAGGSRSVRWAWSLVGLGIVLFLLALAGWWARDAIGTVANEGEADIGETVTFTADGGSYRLLSSGPLRPEPEQTYCDVTSADGSTRRLVGGTGLQTGRLGVDRLATFDPPAGRTEVRCTLRGRDGGQGRFQVLDADGVASKVLVGTIVAALASLGIGAVLLVRGYRTSTSGAATTGPGDRWREGFDPGGHEDDDPVDTTPDPD